MMAVRADTAPFGYAPGGVDLVQRLHIDLQRVVSAACR